MNAPRAIRHTVVFLSLLAFLGGLPACGGGSGGSAVPTKVALFLTDGPTDDYSHVNVTVTSIALLGAGGQVPLLSQEKTFDLLALTSEAALLTLVEGLPEGSYDKLRMEVSRVEIIRRDGTPVEEVKLPSGKIDLNPKGPFTVVAGEPLLIVLDFDAEKSIHVVKTGGGGKVVFRPVVFVKVADAVAFGRLVRAAGTARDIDAGAGSFTLEGPPDDARVLAGEASFFGPDGLPSGFEALADGGFVTVAGFPVTDGAGSEPLGIEAVVAEVGTAWTAVSGTVISAPAASGTFAFLPDDEAWGSSVQAVLQEGTRVYGPFGQELSSADLLPGTRARIDAVAAGDDAAGYTLLAALVVLRAPVQGAVGTITAIDGAALAFSLLPAEGTTVSVQATGGTLFLLMGKAAGGIALTEASFSDLAVGQMAAVSGYLSPSGTIQAACVAAWWASEFPVP